MAAFLLVAVDSGPMIEDDMICILGGGGCFALNLARYIGGLDCCGIGRSAKSPPFMLAPADYAFTQLHMITEQPRLFALLDDMQPEIIVNYAAQGEGAASFGEHADWFYATNTLMLVRLVEFLRTRTWLKRFVQISTSELYGSVTEPANEDAHIRPSSRYAVSKAAFDMDLEIAHRIHGFPMNIIRPSNCITSGQQLHRVVPKAIICALTGQKLPLHGGGQAQKSYMDANDLSRAVMTVLDVGDVGEIYNCGPSASISIRELVAMVAKACGVAFDDLVQEYPERIGQDGRYFLNSAKLGALGWWPETELQDGINEMVSWVKKFPELLTISTEFKLRP